MQSRETETDAEVEAAIRAYMVRFWLIVALKAIPIGLAIVSLVEIWGEVDLPAWLDRVLFPYRLVLSGAEWLIFGWWTQVIEIYLVPPAGVMDLLVIGILLAIYYLQGIYAGRTSSGRYSIWGGSGARMTGEGGGGE